MHDQAGGTSCWEVNLELIHPGVLMVCENNVHTSPHVETPTVNMTLLIAGHDASGFEKQNCSDWPLGFTVNSAGFTCDHYFELLYTPSLQHQNIKEPTQCCYGQLLY